ncbi:ribosomal-protein-alanine N-acetyltransferase [Natronobacillus azotifigens]|uniref:[Ribosomal protein bS18]-alanine N-acetyltransferase n=1 Tax=Natronobacillus azotifigens TaxID=472978 RepID=A0A9J6RFJ7_9BACI|nr:ribosomal protein S18-alanine N-acetyltransferase [Natronobacillus azotifigens]MCZ0704190.1 ribosomal protein S18-alanine N-acetyltransferase [Natronobacillus azotifigens]
MSEVNIRPMEVDDIPQVTIIEERSFTLPWTQDIYRKEITDNNFAHYFVIENKERIIGFCGVWIVLDEAQVTNIAISPDFRGNGYGSMLFQAMLNQVITLGARKLSLEVRVSNNAAKKLYRKFGLKPGGIRKKYYTDNNEDALVMWVKL